MFVSMVYVGVMSVPMLEGLMDMNMRMSQAVLRRIPVRMPMVNVMAMRMLVRQRQMNMSMHVVLGEMQPHTDSHQEPRRT